MREGNLVLLAVYSHTLSTYVTLAGDYRGVRCSNAWNSTDGLYVEWRH